MSINPNHEAYNLWFLAVKYTAQSCISRHSCQFLLLYAFYVYCCSESQVVRKILKALGKAFYFYCCSELLEKYWRHWVIFLLGTVMYRGSSSQILVLGSCWNACHLNIFFFKKKKDILDATLPDTNKLAGKLHHTRSKLFRKCNAKKLTLLFSFRSSPPQTFLHMQKQQFHD